MMDEVTGRVAQIQSGVVDVEFPEKDIPDIYEELQVLQPGMDPVVLEVQRHLGNNMVRTVAMSSTDGLQRGVPVCRQHA
ncbi:MAG TPA: F0F1 ATP synthase subunit beta, partial [Anaerolineales bacterium]